MDISTGKGSIPTTDDQELANLLARLNQEKQETPASAEEAEAAASSTPTDPVATDDKADTAVSTTASTVFPLTSEGSEEPAVSEESTELTEPTESTASAEPFKPADLGQHGITGEDIASLAADAADIATPNPLNVIDELNARDIAPAIQGPFGGSRSEPGADELVDLAGTAPLELLDLDAETIAAASDEAEQKPGVAASAEETAADVSPSAAAEMNIVRDKILDHLSGMIRDINQPPREKFETIVSIMRGAGDHSLLKNALETAMQIEDPSEKAKALTELVGAIDELSAKKS